MKRYLNSVIAAAAITLCASGAQAASVVITAGTSSAFLGEIDSDPTTPGIESAFVGITGLVDDTENAPAAVPVGSSLTVAFALDLGTLLLSEGTYSIDDGAVTYLSGALTFGQINLDDPTVPTFIATANSHASDIFDVGTILGDFSVGVVFPTTPIGPFSTLTDAIEASPFAVSSSILFESSTIAPVPLPAGGLLLITALGAFVMRTRRNSTG